MYKCSESSTPSFLASTCIFHLGLRLILTAYSRNQASPTPSNRELISLIERYRNLYQTWTRVQDSSSVSLTYAWRPEIFLMGRRDRQSTFWDLRRIIFSTSGDRWSNKSNSTSRTTTELFQLDEFYTTRIQRWFVSCLGCTWMSLLLINIAVLVL